MFSEKYMEQVIELENNVEDYHQLVLDLFYEDWSEYKENGLAMSYSDMLNNGERKYSKFEKYLVMIGKYNQQVGNGGHDSYVGNSYAGSIDLELHYELINMDKWYGTVFDSKVYEEVSDIMDSIYVDTEEYYEEETYDEEDDSYYMGEYVNKNYHCVIDVDDLNGRYYEVCVEWMDDIEKYCRETVTKQYNEYLNSIQMVS